LPAAKVIAFLDFVQQLALTPTSKDDVMPPKAMSTMSRQDRS